MLTWKQRSRIQVAADADAVDGLARAVASSRFGSYGERLSQQPDPAEPQTLALSG